MPFLIFRFPLLVSLSYFPLAQAASECNGLPGHYTVNPFQRQGGFVAKSAFVEVDSDGVNVPYVGRGVQVCELASVSGNARLTGFAVLYGSARVYGKAQVHGDSQVYGNAKVSGNAQIFNSVHVFGNAKIYGDARICENAWVFENARVHGDANVSGEAWVNGDLYLSTGQFQCSGLWH